MKSIIVMLFMVAATFAIEPAKATKNTMTFEQIEAAYKLKSLELVKMRDINNKAAQQVTANDSILKFKSDSSLDAAVSAIKTTYNTELLKIQAQEDALKTKKANLESDYKNALYKIGAK